MFTLHNSRFTWIRGWEGASWKGSGWGAGGDRAEWVGKITFILTLKDSVYLPAKKGKHIFILGKQASHFPKKIGGHHPCLISLCGRTHVLGLHAVYNAFACRRGGKPGWLGMYAPFIFILYIFVYINYIAMYEHRFCYICLFLFPTKLAHNGDSFV